MSGHTYGDPDCTCSRCNGSNPVFRVSAPADDSPHATALHALRLAQTALNSKPSFRIDSLPRELNSSYKVLQIIDHAIDNITTARQESDMPTPNTTTPPAAAAHTSIAFAPGDRIRSHDFEPRPGRGDCYIEGTIESIDTDSGVIYFTADLDMWDGRDVTHEATSRAGMRCRTPRRLLLSEWNGRLQKIEE